MFIIFNIIYTIIYMKNRYVQIYNANFKLNLHVYIYMYIHTYTCMYDIYIYIYPYIHTYGFLQDNGSPSFPVCDSCCVRPAASLEHPAAADVVT